ncbi:MAG: type II toxin-antitoxin system VapC family toxin [Nitrospinota bacterium]
MKFLLDTCTFLWIISAAQELSECAKEVFGEPENEVFLSAVSSWEIAIKHSLGRLSFPGPPNEYIPSQRKKHNIAPLEIDEESALHLIRIPELHKDPFDRMLVSQALIHGLIILTPDKLISQYPVKIMW